MSDLDPIAGKCYRRLDADRLFTVVAVDDLDGTILVRYVDGSVNALTFGDWLDIELEPGRSPRD